MNIIPNWLKNISITRKLYFIVGIMALLIAFELFALWFAVSTLSSVRAYVGGEGLWSKAQKDAIYYLQKYGNTHNEEDYQQFLKFTKVPLGDYKTFLELSKPNPDLNKAREGFLEGRNHPDDIDGMISLILRFHEISYLKKALEIWGEATPIFKKLIPIANKLHMTINKGASQQEINYILRDIDPINQRLTELEDQFSYTLGEGSRWLEGVILKILFIVVATIESTGLFLTITVSMAISKGINEVVRVSAKVAKADFSDKAKIFSKDEIGQLASSFNDMTNQLAAKIEERNTAEAELIRQKNLYETLVNAQSDMGEGVAITEGTRIIFANQALCKMYGYSEQEIFAMSSFINIVEESDRTRLVERLQKRLAEVSMSDTGETVVVRKDGKHINIEYSVKMIKTEEKTQLVSIIRDITSRKMAENKFRALLESAPDAMVIIGRKGKIQLVNAQAESLFGYKREHMIGENIELLIPDYHSSYVLSPDVKKAETSLELFGRRTNGSQFAVEINLSPLETEEELLILAAIRDISEKKKASKALQDYATKLEQSNKELEQFAYVASHDLKEPLRTVNSFVQLLQSRYGHSLGSDANEFINYTVDGVRRMEQLINDLLTYSRVSSQEQKYEVVNCNHIMEIIIQSLQGSIQIKKAEITFDPLPTIIGSKIQITQLFQNLINNAIKFHGSSDPKIHISSSDNERKWTFSVSDNGIGIDMRYMEKIFTIFQRLHSRSQYEGTGIGLAICKKIVTRHDGEIWVDSELNKGSTFHFSISKHLSISSIS